MNKVKVRIAVAVNTKGGYHAIGDDSPENDDRLMRDAIEWNGDDPNQIVHFVTAELPIPAPATVEGEVEA